MELAEELRLGEEPDAVPRARHFVREQLSGYDPELRDSAELVVSELVTNARLHALPPLVVRVLARPRGALRLEVQDGSRRSPVRSRMDAAAMTGRGIALVEQLATRWGVELLDDGKVVWCELAVDDSAGTGSGPDSDTLLRAWDHQNPGPTFTVTLGDVPTDLLLEAKAHVDNLVREFTLAAQGADSGSTAAVPEALRLLIEAVVHRFADARNAIKRQALAAAYAGQERTRLTLTLPVSAADAGDAYLDALDQADEYAHAARLLTLASPPQHRVFRHWYVQSLVAQLRALARGEPPPPIQTFEQRLLAELETVSLARQLADRAARLQAVTSALAGATTTDEVTSVVVHQGLDALGATSGSVMLPRDRDTLYVSSAIGYAEQVVRALSAEPADAQLPGASVLRTGEPVWLESRHDIESRFPGLSELEPRTQSLCAVPASLAGRVLGALRFSFDRPRLFDPDERRFVLALAAQAAQALDRAAAYAAERRARTDAEKLAIRLARLQQVTADLTTAGSVEHAADFVTDHVLRLLGASYAGLYLLDAEARPRVVRQKSSGGEAVPAVAVEQTVSSNQAVIDADAATICVPLHSGERRLGAIAVRFPAGYDVDDPGEVALLLNLADAAAQAVERARAQARAERASDRLAFLAEASAQLSSSLDYTATLTTVSRLLVPRMADWCAITLRDGDRIETVEVAHVDPAKVVLAERLQRRYPPDADAPYGIHQVLRTGRPELYPELPEELLEQTAVDDEHRRLRRELGLRSALLVPLQSVRGTFGVLTLVNEEGRASFGAEDLTFAQELARRAATALENAREYHVQTGRLAQIERVAEAAQQAILAPMAERVGPVGLAAAYVSAAREALVGGDLYEVIRGSGRTRMLIGDVRGKGLDAVRLATVVLGYFRAAAVESADLADVARQMDKRLLAHLDGEDFVTALLVDIDDDGLTRVVSCGHPPPVHSRGAGATTTVALTPTRPLGLGSDPVPVELELLPGDRLLLYTDGLIEARDTAGAFVELDAVVAPLATGELGSVPRRILDELRRTVGDELGDDLALLVGEYRP